MILLDTSGILSALYPDQRRHREAAAILSESTAPRILSPLILAEVDYFIARGGGPVSELRFLAQITAGVYELASFDGQDVDDASKIIASYHDLNIGLADASLVILAKRYNCWDILTLDERHFRAVRFGRRPFRILPADA